MKFEKQRIGTVSKWLVDEAKKAGLDIDGFEHEITNEFANHVLNRHGNENGEASKGMIAIKEADFGDIPEIVKAPDYVIIGARRKNEDFVIYAKKTESGTMLYFEEVLRGRGNRTLRGKTMYKRKGDLDKETFISIVTNRDRTDVSSARIVRGAGGISPQ